jgi:hypothetical protein
MFEWGRRAVFSDPSTTAERKQMIPDYPTIEDVYRGRADLRNCCGGVWHITSIPEVLGMAAIEG